MLENILFAFVALIILIPLLYFLPLGFKKQGKLIIVGISLLLALFGMIANTIFNLWQTSLLLLVFALVATYLIEKRLSSFIFADRGTSSLEAEKETSSEQKELSFEEVADTKKVPTFSQDQPFKEMVEEQEKVSLIADRKLNEIETRPETGKDEETIEVVSDNFEEWADVVQVDELNEQHLVHNEDTIQSKVHVEDELNESDDTSIVDYNIDEIIQDTEVISIDDKENEIEKLMSIETIDKLETIDFTEEVENTTPSEELIEDDCILDEIPFENNEEGLYLVDEKTDDPEELRLDSLEELDYMEEDLLVEEDTEIVDELEDTIEEDLLVVEEEVEEEVEVEEDGQLSELEVLIEEEEQQVEEEALDEEEEQQVEEEALDEEEEQQVEEEALDEEEEQQVEEEALIEEEEQQVEEKTLDEEEEQLVEVVAEENMRTRQVKQQMIHTMVASLQHSRKYLSSSMYEHQVKAHLHPSLPSSDYYTFAYLLIEHYISEHNEKELVSLITHLKEKFTNYAIIQQQLQFLEEYYCKK
jgi:hypothetical protein